MGICFRLDVPLHSCRKSLSQLEKTGVWDTGLAEDFRHIIGASSQGHGLALHNHILAGNGRWGSLTVTSATVEPMINACFNFISSHESYFYMVQYKHCCL